MKLTHKQLKQIIKEELKKVLEEGIPGLGLAGLMGKAASNIKNRDSAPEPSYRRTRSSGYEPVVTSIKEIISALKDYGFVAYESAYGRDYIWINYKKPGWFGDSVESIKIYPKTNLSFQDALQNAIDQIAAQDPDNYIRSGASKRMGSTVNIDDPLMERKRRR